MDLFASILAFTIFVGVTIVHYMKPRDTNSMEYILSKIYPFSKMINGVVYNPHQAHLLAYHFSTFKQRMNGDMPGYSNDTIGVNLKKKEQREKAAFKITEDDGDETFFILYWWRNYPKNQEFCTFNNKQSFLDEIYTYWGVELHQQLSENLGCRTQTTT